MQNREQSRFQRYYENHREELRHKARERMRQYRQTPDGQTRLRAHVKNWKSKNPAKVSAQLKRRRERLKLHSAHVLVWRKVTLNSLHNAHVCLWQREKEKRTERRRAKQRYREMTPEQLTKVRAKARALSKKRYPDFFDSPAYAAKKLNRIVGANVFTSSHPLAALKLVQIRAVRSIRAQKAKT